MSDLQNNITDTEELHEAQFVFMSDDGIASRSIINPAANPMLALQWYIDAESSSNSAATRVNSIWAEATGKGVSVAIMDSGFQHQHLELTDRLNAGTGLSGVSASNDHATQVAGVLGADASNGFGMVGVAYNATLAQVDFSYVTAAPTRTQVADGLRVGSQSDVLNASWGYRGQFQDNFADTAWAGVKSAIADSATNGRDGLGTAIVFAAGNDRQYVAGSSALDGDNSNYHSLTNARQIITVGASDQFGKNAVFSTPGASLLVSAPGVSIFTTGVVSGRESALDGFETVSGTSFAAPIVSGVIALMLEANPDLGYRDIQTILTATAQRTGDFASWSANGATNWNGGGALVNHDLGFGVVDARAAVRLAQSWDKPSETAANELSVTMTTSPAGQNALVDGGSVSRMFTLPADAADLDLEWVELDFGITHNHIGDLTVTLTSPSGLTSVLIDRPGSGANTRDNLVATLTSTHFRGEDPNGVWGVTVSDAAGNGGGTINQMALRLFGAATSENTTHIFTDDVAKLTDRNTLVDTSGTNTLNLVAMTLDNNIDLSGHKATFGGNIFNIGAGSHFDVIHGGDGVDQINASGLDRSVTFNGGFGNDVLIGGNMADRLSGGEGADVLFADGKSADTIDGGAGFDTADFSLSSERVIIDLAAQTARTASAVIVLTGIETVSGSSYSDYILGSASADNLFLAGGNDTASGGESADMLNGGEGNDVLFGNNGADILIGGGGADVLLGGDSADMLFGEEGDDLLFAGEGAGSLLDGGTGNDWLLGGADTDYMVGGEGDDVLYGSGGANAMYGGAGNDILISGDGAGSVLVGGDGNNELWGGNGDDYIVGGDDVDVIIAGQGSDYIFGCAGDDTILAGDQTDYIYGNSGNDFIYTDDSGVFSNDYIYVGGGTGTDTIADFTTIGNMKDVLVISLATGFNNFDQIKSSISQAGVYSVVSLGLDNVYLYNVSAWQMTADNFIFM